MRHDKRQRKKQELEKRINSLEKRLKTLPDGKLICAGNGGYCKWYRSDGKTNSYIPQKESPMRRAITYRTI